MAREHVTAIVTHMKGKCQYWDVVNEPFAGNGSLKDTLWKRALGQEYLATVLQWVHSIDPDAILFLNDVRALQPKEGQPSHSRTLWHTATSMATRS